MKNFENLLYKDKGIKSLKMLWAHALSGQDLMKSDGILGLGIEYDDDLDDDVQEGSYEQDVGILSRMVDSFDGIDDRIMSLFIANTATNT